MTNLQSASKQQLWNAELVNFVNIAKLLKRTALLEPLG